MSRTIITWASGLLVVAVILGAFGAHALKERLSMQHLAQWRTGVEYQFYHSLGLLLLAALVDRIGAEALKRTFWCFVVGIIFFSGSLYLLSTRELSGLFWIGKAVGPITPVGGLLFIAGWIQVMVAAWRSPIRS